MEQGEHTSLKSTREILVKDLQPGYFRLSKKELSPNTACFKNSFLALKMTTINIIFLRISWLGLINEIKSRSVKIHF